jgi:DNA repair protein RadC
MSNPLLSSLDALAGAGAASLSLLVGEERGGYREAAVDEVLQAAQRLLAARVRGANVLSAPADVREFLKARLSTLEHEVFALLHLDAQHRVLDYVEMFRGTLTQSAVYPREVVKDALRANAAAVILIHNHPSGLTHPSPADETLTRVLTSALALVDVRVLDHFVVGGTSVFSFAEHGLL